MSNAAAQSTEQGDIVEGLPIVPHMAGEFYAWLWWASEQRGAAFELPDPVGHVELWIDDRLAFRNPDDTKLSAVMTGDNPAATLEARAALAGGKVLQEIRIGVRRDDREFQATLKGPSAHLHSVKLPQLVSEGGEEVLYDRIHLYEELCFVIAGLFQEFARTRTGDSWQEEVLPALHGWILGRG
ncbi:MAG TPA: hypothetical protein ENK18_00210 [Deltaproteobacteria bacterium]|nr:hypothetical protein [Deltaproteobacteria bacterium]